MPYAHCQVSRVIVMINAVFRSTLSALDAHIQLSPNVQSEDEL